MIPCSTLCLKTYDGHETIDIIDNARLLLELYGRLRRKIAIQPTPINANP